MLFLWLQLLKVQESLCVISTPQKSLDESSNNTDMKGDSETDLVNIY
jgi:hypothetical protein